MPRRGERGVPRSDAGRSLSRVRPRDRALTRPVQQWLQQATLAIRAHVPLDVLTDTIQPFPTFSEIYVEALKSLRGEIAAKSKTVGAGPPMVS